MLHICLIGPIPPPWGGVQTHMMELRSRIREAGMRCSMINLTRHRQPEHDDLYFPSTAVDLMRQLRALNPDVVHLHTGGAFFLKHAGLLLYLAMRPRSASVFTFHSGGFPTSPEGRAARASSIRGFVLRRLDAVIGVNRELVQTFARYGVRPERNHLIEPHADNLDHAAIRSEALPPSIAEFANSHSPLLVTVGLLEPEYALELQLAALPAIRSRHSGAGLVIIGSGSLDSALREAIANHPDREHVLLCGDVPRPKTLATIARATMLLRTTRYDGDALSVREALAIGTPVVATDNGMRPPGVLLLDALTPGAIAEGVTAVMTRSANNGAGPSPATEPPPRTEADPIGRVLDLYRAVMSS